MRGDNEQQGASAASADKPKIQKECPHTGLNYGPHHFAVIRVMRSTTELYGLRYFVFFYFFLYSAMRRDDNRSLPLLSNDFPG